MAGDDVAGRTSKAALTAGTVAGSIDPKIIGGNETTISTAPWMAQLHYYDDRAPPAPATTSASSAAARSSRRRRSSPPRTASRATTGTPTAPSSPAPPAALGQRHRPARRYRHGGLAAVEPPVVQRDDHRQRHRAADARPAVKATPIRMTTSGDTASYKAGVSAKVYGWGRTSSTSDDISETLKTATLPMQSDTTCSGAYGRDFVKGHMVCAGKPATGSDAGTVSAVQRRLRRPAGRERPDRRCRLLGRHRLRRRGRLRRLQPRSARTSAPPTRASTTPTSAATTRPTCGCASLHQDRLLQGLQGHLVRRPRVLGQLERCEPGPADGPRPRRLPGPRLPAQQRRRRLLAHSEPPAAAGPPSRSPTTGRPAPGSSPPATSPATTCPTCSRSTPRASCGSTRARATAPSRPG